MMDSPLKPIRDVYVVMAVLLEDSAKSLRENPTPANVTDIAAGLNILARGLRASVTRFDTVPGGDEDDV
jgi:hypothetical protein